MRRMEIVPLQTTGKGDVQRRRCRISRFDSEKEGDTFELWFELGSSISIPEANDADSHVLALLMDAMQEDREMVVKGSVSQDLLSNLTEFQAVWSKLLPDTYKTIEIIPDEIRTDESRTPGAICAYSGGVDGSFSVWRHSQKKWGHRSQDIKLCAIVHGFDIPLEDEAAFADAEKRGRATLDSIGIGLESVRTNLREHLRTCWEHSFLCALVATLGHFKKVAGTCIVGSGVPYDYLVIPWGSSPVTDHLLNAGDLAVMHDGASHSRTEKVAEIAEWSEGVANLRVCWQGPKKGENCGRCEKCIRTKFNFLATSNPVPDCIPGRDLLGDLGAVVIRNDFVRIEWQQIYDYAIRHKVEASWVPRIPHLLRRPLVDYLLPKSGRLRKKLKALLQRTKVRQPAS